MSNAGYRIWASICACWLLLACAAETRQQRDPTLPQGGTAAPPKAGTSSGAAGARASGSGGGFGIDNPGIVEPIPPMVADGGGDSGVDASTEVCEAGSFCEPKGPDGDCGSERVETQTKMIQKPGNVLVIFDRSGSMDAEWNGTPKYQAAGDAIIAALTPLKSLLTIGGVFFPSVDMNGCACNVANPIHWIPGPEACCLNSVGNSCVVTDINQPDQLKFGPADAYISGLPMQWRLQMANGTPLQAGIQRGAEALMGANLMGPVAVIVITDGEPNCNTNTQAVLDQVKAWQMSGIPTHAIGLPGAQAAADVLNMIAQTGGTDKYVDPSNVMELEAKIRSILTSTIRSGFESCVFDLDKKTEVPEKLHLVVRENGQDKDVPRDLSSDPNWGDGAGWQINAEGNKVEITGRLCDLAKEGAYEQLRFDYGCVDLPPPEPPIGPT